MSTNEPIIDINPVTAVRDKAAEAAATYRAPSYGKTATRAAEPVNATIIDDPKAKGAKKPSRIAGAAQTVVGGAVMLVGVPMLILPGPGLLAIAGGAVVAGSGIKKLLGK